MPLNINLQQILLHLLNFVILFVILYFLLYSPIKKFMEKRTEEYKKMASAVNPYGDGFASRRIADAIIEKFADRV